MSLGAALTQAGLGESLRRLPSELLRRRAGTSLCLEPTVVRAAENLRRAVPGIALMLQLRARLFDDTLGGARKRGMSQVVATGCGFDDERLEALAGVGMRVWHVERPDVLAVTVRARSQIRALPADDLSSALWRRPARDDLGLATERTLFVVQNGSFWPATDGLESWLRAFSVGAAAGSEALLNVFAAGDELAAGAPTLRQSPRVGCDGAVNASAERDRLRALGLRVVKVFDSRDLQRRYLGFDDMLVRERYVWVAPDRGPVPIERRERRPRATAGRLHEAVERAPTSNAPAVGGRKTTYLRSVPSSPGPEEVLTAAAISALTDGGVRCRRRAANALRPFRANRAARHLETMLVRGGDSWDVTLVGSVSPFIAARACDVERRAPAIAVEATRLLESIRRMLGVARSPRVVIDVTSESAVSPLVLTSVDAPYTLVRIPRLLCARPVLAHELTHVLAMARSRWLSEGLAVWVQRKVAPGACFPDDGDDEGDEVPTEPVSLEARLGTPAGPVRWAMNRGWRSRARREYRDAARFVEFFVRRFTRRRFLGFFAACTATAAPGALRAACLAIGCTSVADLERRWRAAETPSGAHGGANA